MQQQIERPPSTFAGIDVGKDGLDIFVHPVGVHLKARNQRKAIETLTAELIRHGVDLVAMEATSTYHRLAHSILHEAGIAVAVINPFRSRQFAHSIGRLAKTDKIDAHTLALFAQRMAPVPTTPPDEQSRILLADLAELGQVNVVLRPYFSHRGRRLGRSFLTGAFADKTGGFE